MSKTLNYEHETLNCEQDTKLSAWDTKLWDQMEFYAHNFVLLFGETTLDCEHRETVVKTLALVAH